MRSRALAVVRATVPLTASLAFVGCSLAYCGEDAFSRDRELRHGELAGTALVPGPDRKPAAFVQASVRGTSFVRRTNSDGRFVFSGLEEGPWMVTVSEDEDGDGKPERRRIVSAVLRQVPHRTSPSFVPLVGGEGESQLAGVDVGDVLLEGTVRVSGRVLVEGPGGALPPSDYGLVAVVVAGRNLELPRLESDGTDLVSLGAEAKTGVDYAGNFVLRNVSGGSFYLLVLVYAAGATPGQTGALLQVSEPVFLRSPGDNVALEGDIVLPDQSEPPRRPAQLVFSPSPSSAEQVYLVVVPPGLEMPPCEDAPIDYSATPFPYALTTAQRSAEAAPQFPDVPVGVWDMQACFTQSPPGTLFSQPVTPEIDDEDPVLLGPVLLTTLQACVPARPCDSDADCGEAFRCDETAGRCEAPEGWSDCDGDDVRGLPRIVSNDERALWSSCVSACFASSGSAAADSTCDASDGDEYDCDDDGDGQPDVTEAQACYGVGKGTDSDGDGVCDGIDPFPECRANTAADCEAGAEPDVPAVPEEYASGGGTDQCGPVASQNSFEYCAAASGDVTAQCPVDLMSCSFAPLNADLVPVMRCDAATERGCDEGFFCATELTGDDGIAPCVHYELAECSGPGDTAPCAEGYVCLDVAAPGDPESGLRCGANFNSEFYERVVAGETTCSCCSGPECGGEGGGTTVSVTSTAGARVPAACTADELSTLWASCTEASDTAPPDGADAGASERETCDPNDGTCDPGCSPPDPNCDVAIADCDPQSSSTLTVNSAADLIFIGETIDCLLAPESGVVEVVGELFEIIDLVNVRFIQGNLIVSSNTSLSEIRAPLLEEVRGSLTIDNNASLSSLVVESLRLVEGNVGLWRNPYYFPDLLSLSGITVNGTSSFSANGCSGPDQCTPLGLPNCGSGPGLGDAASVCYQCLQDLDCEPFGGGTCDTTYTTPGTGTFRCITADGGA